MAEYRVDLNSDLGESFGNYRIGGDAQIMRYISSANIACGCHAGDPLVMDEAVAGAKAAGIGTGAHPGYPDLQGFGRRNMALSAAEVKAYVIYQLGALTAFCKKQGVELQHVKPHGALYNTAAKDSAVAKAVAEAVKEICPDAILVGLAGGELIAAGKAAGLKVAEEVFADRQYEEDGTLRARSFPDAMVTDEDLAVTRVVRMIREGKVRAVTGRDIPIRADSVCVHGDGEKALLFVQKLRAALTAEGVEICRMSEFI